MRKLDTVDVRALTDSELDLATGGLSLRSVGGKDISDWIKTTGPTCPVPPKGPIAV